MSQVIQKPLVTTYFIAYDGSHPPSHYGVLKEENVLETAYNDIEIFTIKEDFLESCQELEIDTTEIFDS